MERSFVNTGTKFQSAGAKLTAGLTVPLGVLAGVAVKAAVDFESSFAGVRKTVNATEKQFAELAAGLRNMSKSLPVSVNELNRIAESAGQLGIQRQNILGFTRVIADMAVSTNMTADQAATAMARIANIMQMPQDQFSNLGSVIVDLGNNFATTEAEITEFGLRIAGAGSIAGLTVDNIMAIGAAMSSVGVQAEAGGTAVQKVLMSMVEAVNTGKNLAQLDALMPGGDFAGEFKKDSGMAFVQFVEGLGKAGDQAIPILKELGMQDQRLMRAFLSLANAGNVLRSSVEMGSKAWRENTALTTEAEKRYATTASQFQVLKNRVLDVAITFGQALIPSLMRMMPAIETILGAVAGAVQAFSNLPPAVQTAAIAFGGVLAAIGPLAFAFGTLMQTGGALIGMFRTMAGASAVAAIAPAANGARLAVTGLSAALLATPVGMIVSGIGLIAAAYVSLKDRIRDAAAAQGFWEASARTAATLMGGTPLGAILQRLGLDLNSGAQAPASTSRGNINLGLAGSVHDPANAAATSAASQMAGVFKAVSDQASEAAKQAAKAWQKELDRLSGREAIKVGNDWLKKVKAIGGATKLAADDQRSYNRALNDAIDAMLRLDMAVDPNIFNEWMRTALPPIQSGFGPMRGGIPGESLRPTNMTDVALSQLPPVVDGLPAGLLPGQVPLPTAPPPPPASFWANLMPALSQMQGMGPSWLQNITGGVMNAGGLLADGNWRNLTNMQRLGGLASAGTGLAGLFGQEYTSTGSQMASGAMQGLSAGAMFGPLGAGIGLGVGALVGLIAGLMKSHGERAMEEVGREWGITISQATAEAIEADMELFDGQRNNRWAAEVLNLGRIIQDAGGVTDANFDSLVSQARQAFVFLDEGLFTAEQVGQVMDESFGAFVEHMENGSGIAQREMLELIHLTRQWGVESKAITEFLEQQSSKAAAGFNTIAQNFVGLGFSSAQLEGMRGEGADTSQLEAFLQTNLPNIGVLAQASFAALLDAGFSVIEALEMMAPGLDTVAATLERMGIAAPAAFGDILQLQGIVNQHRELFTTLSGVDEMMKGLHNTGLMTQESFSTLTGMVVQAFDTLVNSGVAGDQALRLMQPQLQTIWELANDFGLAVDDGTQALLNQAAEAGVVGEHMKPVQEQMLTAMQQMRDVTIILAETLGATIPNALRGLPPEAQAAADGISNAFKGIDVPAGFSVSFDAEGNKQGSGTFDSSGNPVPQMKAGGIVRARRGGTLVNVGEGGTDEAIVPLRRSSISRGVSSRQGDVYLDGELVGRVLLPALANEAQRLGVS